MGFLHDKTWGGIITKQGCSDASADFEFGIYNNHHYHLGYFIYGIAVLTKLDPTSGKEYKPQACSLVHDFMNLGTKSNPNYPRLRCFDFYMLHSRAGGLTEFVDGRKQKSTSEAVNAYYSAALLSLAYGDAQLVSLGSTLSAFEILAAKVWWHVEEGRKMYERVFMKENKITGVLWANKRDTGLWFGPADWRECRLGIHVLPLVPISEDLFSKVGHVKELVKWSRPALHTERWKGIAFALEGIYDKVSALKKIRSLKGFDEGNSLTNLLWWIHTRS